MILSLGNKKIDLILCIIMYCITCIQIMKNFGRDYHRRLRGKSRFVWTDMELATIIQGLFRYHRSKRQGPLVEIAPLLRSRICEYVKNHVCCFHNNSGWAEGHYERICARWIRLPSLRAVVLKLQLYSQLVKNVVHGLTKSSYQKMREKMRVSGSGMTIMSGEFYMAFKVFNDVLHNNCYHEEHHCRSRSMPLILPARPMLTFEPVYGYCYTCGVGLSDATVFKFVPRRSCLGIFDNRRIGGDDVCLCSGCIDTYVDE